MKLLDFVDAYTCGTGCSALKNGGGSDPTNFAPGQLCTSAQTATGCQSTFAICNSVNNLEAILYSSNNAGPAILINYGTSTITHEFQCGTDGSWYVVGGINGQETTPTTLYCDMSCDPKTETCPSTSTLPACPQDPGNPGGCCPVWGPWVDSGSCSDTCGACGVITKTRACLTEGTCPCSSPSTKSVPCNTFPCSFPRKSCCSDMKIKVENKNFTCGPLPADPEDPPSACSNTQNSVLSRIKSVQANQAASKSKTCPSGGSWSSWTSSCSDTCGMCGKITRKRTCLSASSGCPCSENNEYFELNLDDQTVVSVAGKQIPGLIDKISTLLQEFDEVKERQIFKVKFFAQFDNPYRNAHKNVINIPGVGRVDDRRHRLNPRLNNRDVTCLLSYYISPDFTKIYWNISRTYEDLNVSLTKSMASSGRSSQASNLDWIRTYSSPSKDEFDRHVPRRRSNLSAMEEEIYAVKSCAYRLKIYPLLDHQVQEMWFFTPDSPNRHWTYFCAETKNLPKGVQKANWYKIEGRKIPSNKPRPAPDYYVKILKIEKIPDLMPTVLGSDNLVRFKTDVYIKNIEYDQYTCYSRELRRVYDVNGLLRKYKVGDQALVWCSYQPICGIFWRINKVEKIINEEAQEYVYHEGTDDNLSEVPEFDEPSSSGVMSRSLNSATISKSAKTAGISSCATFSDFDRPSTSSAFKTTATRQDVPRSQETYEETGVIVSENQSGYLVYSPCRPREILLAYETTKKGWMNLGTWISFSSNKGRVTTYHEIEPKFETMPILNSVLVQCKILIPSDYTPRRYQDTVSSEFFPKVVDQHKLINKECVGKFMVAVIEYAPNNEVNQDIPWVISYVYYE